MSCHIALQTVALSICIFALARPACFAAVANPRVLENLSYHGAATAADRQQTLDLYLPPKQSVKPPLLILFPGGLWTSHDEHSTQSAHFAAELARRNVNAAVVCARLAPAHRHPAAIEDGAAAIAYLVRNSDKYGYNGQRIFIAGYASGAHTAALLALDQRYLASHGLKPQNLAGVIGLNGVYDLAFAQKLSSRHAAAIEQAFGADSMPADASLARRDVPAHVPPFLLLNSTGAQLGSHVDARKYADALRARGHSRVEQTMVPGRDALALLDMASAENQARSLILHLVKNEPLPAELTALRTARQQWQKTPYTTLPFWQHGELIQTHPVDRRFIQHLLPIYGPLKHELLEWPLEQFHAVDLFAYIDRVNQGKAPSPFLVTINLRNEKQFWKRSDLEPHRPMLVVGLDEEKNLFRFTVFYRMLREYSWQSKAPPPVMSRPLGGFIYFLRPPPEEYSPQSAHFGLSADGFQTIDRDPLQPLQNLSKPVTEALTYRNGCVYCHTFRGVGTRAHHVTSAGASHGGLALPLEQYPADVWKNFIYRQEEAADKIGATPNPVAPPARDELFRLVEQSRAARPGK